MKYVKMLGLLTVTAATMMTFAGTASATLEDEGGALKLGATIHASSSGATSTTGTLTITCQKSTLGGKVTSNGAISSTISVETLTFTECGNHTVSVNQKGALTINSKNQIFSTGAEVTKLFHSALLGTVHCIYATASTDIGDLTEGTGARLDIPSKWIDQVKTDAACGDHSTWEGTYTFSTPHTLNNN